jgi:hypothetical protein
VRRCTDHEFVEASSQQKKPICKGDTIDFRSTFQSKIDDGPPYVSVWMQHDCIELSRAAPLNERERLAPPRGW